MSRHGWGCKPDAAAAVNYLSAAASNAADIENLALQAGLKKGGAAKGELVLAIFELANCFRHGWGIPKDPIAAKQVGCPPSFTHCRRREVADARQSAWAQLDMILSPCPAIPCPLTNTALCSTTKRRQILAIPVRWSDAGWVDAPFYPLLRRF